MHDSLSLLAYIFVFVLLFFVVVVVGEEMGNTNSTVKHSISSEKKNLRKIH